MLAEVELDIAGANVEPLVCEVEVLLDDSDDDGLCDD